MLVVVLCVDFLLFTHTHAIRKDKMSKHNFQFWKFRISFTVVSRLPVSQLTAGMWWGRRKLSAWIKCRSFLGVNLLSRFYFYFSCHHWELTMVCAVKWCHGKRRGGYLKQGMPTKTTQWSNSFIRYVSVGFVEFMALASLQSSLQQPCKCRTETFCVTLR